MIVGLVTTKNEETTIGPLVRGLARLTDEVLVVDEVSTDQTVAEAVRAGARVCIYVDEPRGIGPALMYGWRTVLERGARRIIQIDAGGSHDPLDAAGLLECGAEVVIGSRFMHGASYRGRRLRALASRAAAVGCSIAALAPISDWTSGYRAFHASALEKLLDQPYRARMHGWQIEVLAHAWRLGIPVSERPIHYQAGRSSLNGAITREAIDVWWELLWR